MMVEIVRIVKYLTKNGRGGKYDLVAHYFREGLRLKPVSYQARHALAKNLMECAIDQNEDILYAPYIIWMKVERQLRR